MRTISYTDDDAGRLDQARPPSPVAVHTYDARGLMTDLLDTVSNETTWQYNGQGLGLAKSETNELAETRAVEH